MIPKEDITNRIFGRLRVLSFNDSGKYSAWNCVCECGVKKVVRDSCLKAGTTRSCGCLWKEDHLRRHTTHGLSKHPLYLLVHIMRERCHNPNDKDYENYGGRGIIVCEEWRNNALAFVEWALKNGYSKGLQIDRERNNEGYSPNNCRFVPCIVNSRNKRNIVFFEYQGRKLKSHELSEICGIPSQILVTRILHHKWDIDRALTQPVRKRSFASGPALN